MEELNEKNNQKNSVNEQKIRKILYNITKQDRFRCEKYKKYIFGNKKSVKKQNTTKSNMYKKISKILLEQAANIEYVISKVDCIRYNQEKGRNMI